MGALIPDRIEEGFDRLQPDWLRSKGIRLVLADLDNTLTRYRQLEPDPALITWRDGLHEAGITLFVISNSRRPNRAQQFCANLDVPYISHAGKPHAAAFHQAMEAPFRLLCRMRGERV